MSKHVNVVMIIPTGIGCEIGGHAGDATPAARLLGSVSNKLILHPNVVNASDINEMPENALYVEGSILDRFLEGQLELEEVRSNKILVVVNKPVRNETINAVNAAIETLGIEAEIVELNTELEMIGYTGEDGNATGAVSGWQELIDQIYQLDFDALAIASLIKVDRLVAKEYWKNGGVNPWGGIEAITSKLIASALNCPVAHAPIQPVEVIEEERRGEYDFVCDPRAAAEFVSNCFLFCVLKGLARAPRIGKGLGVKDVDVLVSPFGCWGRPHLACYKAGIPIIVVRENTTIYKKEVCGEHRGGKVIYVENYHEAAGIIAGMNIGLTKESVRRPLERVKVST